MRQLLKKLGQTLGWYVLLGLFYVSRNQHLSFLRICAKWLGSIAYSLVRSRRKLIHTNLLLINPQIKKEAIYRIGKQTVFNILEGMFDLFYLCWHPNEFYKIVTVHYSPAVEELIKSDSGIIVTTGHISLFPLLIFPHIWHGRPCAVMVKEPHDNRVAKFFTSLRTKLGIHTISHFPPIIAARKAIDLLNKQGVILFAIDLYPGRAESVEVTFLGQRTLMFSAPVRFAARANVPIVLGYVQRHTSNYSIYLEGPLKVPHQAADRDHPTTIEFVQQLADWLSSKIQSRPEQWWSIHRRWKNN